MTLTRSGYQRGLDDYLAQLRTRSQAENERTGQFPGFTVAFRSRTPGFFSRDDLQDILVWKHTDGRRRAAALKGLAAVSDDALRKMTEDLGRTDDPWHAAALFCGKIKWVGIATASAIFAAAKPETFPVIDIFALKAIREHYDPHWLRVVPRDKHGEPVATYESYGMYATFCQKRAAELTSDEGAWRPREVDMALWAIGKQLG